MVGAPKEALEQQEEEEEEERGEREERREKGRLWWCEPKVYRLVEAEVEAEEVEEEEVAWGRPLCRVGEPRFERPPEDMAYPWCQGPPRRPKRESVGCKPWEDSIGSRRVGELCVCVWRREGRERGGNEESKLTGGA